MTRRRAVLRAAVVGPLVGLVVGLLAGCATSYRSVSPTLARIVDVVAAEATWASLAAQLGGDHAHVTSVIANPNADPHDYEPTAADARSLATTQLAVVNGIGYDAWASSLLKANPSSGRVVLNVGHVVGIRAGGNPHRWYSPSDVRAVIDAISSAYQRLDPVDSRYFAQQRTTVLSVDLKDYFGLVSSIKAKYAGAPVGASESVFAPLSDALGLRLLTPESFLDAVSEGSDPTAADKAAVDRQIREREIKVYVYNSQNATPDVQGQVSEARGRGIPVVTVTETLAPAGASFQAWQVRELTDLEHALAMATGR